MLMAAITERNRAQKQNQPFGQPITFQKKQKHSKRSHKRDGGKELESLDSLFRMAASMAPAVAEEGAASLGITKVGKNTRRIEVKVGVKASLDTVWGVLTDYERWTEFVPGLIDSKIIETKDNVFRLSQLSRNKTSVGLTFDSKLIIEFKEKAIETFPFGKKREVEFKMIEGDLQSYEGKWSIEQLNENGDVSTISYVADVKTKMLIPINLVEGKLSTKFKGIVLGVQQEAEKKSSFH